MNQKQRGFTLIELLIVVAIIGLLAAIAIPNLLSAMQRAKQKRTMTDMRTLATAWELRATDVNRYNAAGALTILGTCTEVIDIASLSGALVPTYIKLIPKLDGWSNPWRFRTESPFGDPVPAQSYVIWSAGSNGDPSGTNGFDATASSPGGATNRFDADIIFHNGVFAQYPEGAQTH